MGASREIACKRSESILSSCAPKYVRYSRVSSARYRAFLSDLQDRFLPFFNEYLCKCDIAPRFSNFSQSLYLKIELQQVKKVAIYFTSETRKKRNES